jgi:MFS family permease
MDHPRAAKRPLAQATDPVVVALVVLAIAFVLAALGRGLSESFTVFLLPVSSNFSWDRGAVVSIYSLAALTSGLASPFVGLLFDRFGPRFVFAAGLLGLGSAFLVASFAQRLLEFQLALGFCVGLGVACTGTVPGSILLGRWFGPRLPTAMAVVYSATGAGVLLMLPISQVLIDHLGWQAAYRAYGTALFFALPLVLMLPWKQFATGAPHLTNLAPADTADTDWTLPAAMRHHAFGRCSRHSSSQP